MASNRGHQFVGRSPDFLQAIDVGLSKYSTLAGYFMQLDPVISLQSQLGGGNLQLRVDLVDDSSGSAGTLIVHRGDFFLASGLVVILKYDDFRVLSSELNHRIHLGVKLFDRQRHGSDLLHKLRANLIGNSVTARARHEHPRVVPVDSHLRFHAAQEFQGLFRLLGLVTLVVLPQNLVALGIYDGRLDCGGTDVKPYKKLRVVVVRFLIRSCGNLN
jgi:hypothetical protein